MSESAEMDSARWRRVAVLCENALLVDPKDRARFLAHVCNGDALLQSEVESLLQFEQELGSFLEPPRGIELQSLKSVLREETSGDPEWVGRYRLLERISTGGMGRVYRAVRGDGEFDQTVAVKLIKRGMDTEQIVQRFHRERQTLANLDHPNIARLIDGGTVESGQPFLVMEFVHGRAIDQYCDEHQLSVGQRLRLFLKVCAAVHYAHHNLVVHRDLKPANILVTDDGTPKLLDFGISKLLDGNDMPALATTFSTSRMMTLRYASPEQVSGKAITTASDSYSLGVVLYELLTGRSPYGTHQLSRLELERLVCDATPQKPSAAIKVGDFPSWATRPERLRNRLQGDLDNIVLTALQRDPQRRYSTVLQLSNDIVRHLEGKTVSARPDTLRYRVGKFIRRNTVGVVATALVFLSLVSGAGLAVFGLLQARSETERAVAEADRATRVGDVLRHILESAHPLHRGSGLTHRTTLDDVALQIESKFSDQPATRASLHRTLGLSYLGQGAYRSAEVQLQAACDLRRDHFGEYSLEFAESLSDLGELANTQYDYMRATFLFQESLKVYRRQLGVRHPAVARSLHGLGVAAYNHACYNGHAYWGNMRAQDLYLAAETAISEAIAILWEHGKVVPASYFMDLGMALQRQRKYSAGETAYVRGIQAAQQQFGQDSLAEAFVRFEYAQLLEARCEFEAAETMFRASLEWQRRFLGNRHPNLAMSLNRFADFLLQKLENVEESEALYLEALGIRENFTESERFRRSADKYRRRLCRLYAAEGNVSGAIDIMGGLIQRAKENPVHWDKMHLVLIGDAYCAAEDYSNADRYYQLAFSLFPNREVDVVHALLLLGSARSLAARMSLDDAEHAAQHGLSILRRFLAEDDARLADGLFVLGEVLVAQARFEEGASVLCECLDIRLGVLGRQHSLTTACQHLYDRCLASRE